MSPKWSRKEEVKLILELFQPQDHVLIPIVADPDSIAAALAFRRLLWRKVAACTICYINEIKRPDNLTLIRLLRVKLEPFKKINPTDYNRFVLLDGQPAHSDLLDQLSFDVVIDHHPVDEGTKASLVDIRPNYGATATIMTELLQAAGITPSKTLATALFYAIKTDTDSFTRPTVDEDMKAFRYLYQYADLNAIRKIESSEIPLALLKYFVQAMGDLKIRKDTGFAFLERVNNTDVLVQLADFLMHIQALDTVVVAGVFENRLVVILRNAKSRRNVGKMAEKAFGQLGRAGGHQAAARAEMPLAAVAETGLDVKDNKAMQAFIIQSIRRAGRQTPPQVKATGLEPDGTPRP